jgi:hypothetical protein
MPCSIGCACSFPSCKQIQPPGMFKSVSLQGGEKRCFQYTRMHIIASGLNGVLCHWDRGCQIIRCVCMLVFPEALPLPLFILVDQAGNRVEGICCSRDGGGRKERARGRHFILGKWHPHMTTVPPLAAVAFILADAHLG